MSIYEDPPNRTVVNNTIYFLPLPIPFQTPPYTHTKYKHTTDIHVSFIVNLNPLAGGVVVLVSVFLKLIHVCLRFPHTLRCLSVHYQNRRVWSMPITGLIPGVTLAIGFPAALVCGARIPEF